MNENVLMVEFIRPNQISLDIHMGQLWIHTIFFRVKSIAISEVTPKNSHLKAETSQALGAIGPGPSGEDVALHRIMGVDYP